MMKNDTLGSTVRGGGGRLGEQRQPQKFPARAKEKFPFLEKALMISVPVQRAMCVLEHRTSPLTPNLIELQHQKPEETPAKRDPFIFLNAKETN